MKNKMLELNSKVFSMMSIYLNDYSKVITKDMIREIKNEYISEEEAFKLLLASFCGLNIIDNKEDKYFYNEYFKIMIKEQDVNYYINNKYYQTVIFKNKKIGNCELKYDSYDPYEGFVYDDIKRYGDFKNIPSIGFFNKAFKYPAIYENDRLWMSITPNEINTMEDSINKVSGKVVTFGLGLGYFAFMASEKDSVDYVYVVEKNKKIIDLFTNYILNQFPNKHKITIINDDAYNYIEKDMKKEKFDYCFIDLWHDVSDGLPMYMKFKKYEKSYHNTEFMYWIEKSMNFYL